MKGRKFISKTKIGEYETIKNHIVELPESENRFNWIGDIIDIYDKDWNDAYIHYGMLLDFDGEIDNIDISKFIAGMESYLEDNDDYWNIEEIVVKEIEENLVFLKKYKGYIIYEL